MSFTLEGSELVMQNLENALVNKRKEICRALNSVLADMVNYIKVNGPWQDQSSALRNGISYTPAVDDGDKISGTIYANQEYAIYVEYHPGLWVISGAITEYKDKILSMISERVNAQS